MKGDFDHGAFRSYLVNGKLKAAMDYLSRFPEQSERRARYASRFQEGRYEAFDENPFLNDILLAYQKYYRDVFYLEQPPEDAARRLAARLGDALQSGGGLSELEERAAEAFRANGFYFLGGRTSGFFGPYIWRHEELRRYAVELPHGTQNYAVKLLDGFLMRSWLDYLSFGETGTGGWANGDGLIHCVRSAYDLESEDFQVSLLKHEAQHAYDLERYKGITNPELEYRAKLVELIYSRERNLLARFAAESDPSPAASGHGAAACRITEGAEALLGVSQEEFASLSIEKIQAAARTLFEDSTREAAEKYRMKPVIPQKERNPLC